MDVTLAEFQSIHNEIIILNVKCVRAQGASKRKRVLYFDFESSLLYHCPLGFFSDPVFFSKGGNQRYFKGREARIGVLVRKVSFPFSVSSALYLFSDYS